MAIIMILAGFLFCSVSAYMAGLVGSSNNPVSGITIATILFAAAVLLLLMGKDATIGPVAAVMIGAVVCCAACVAGDNLQDLKAGYIVGATPWRQQTMLAIGSISCALVMAPTLNLLATAYGIGVPTAEHPNPAEPAGHADGVGGPRHVRRRICPGAWSAIGARIGIAVIVLDEILRQARLHVPHARTRGRRGHLSTAGAMVPIFLGGLLNHVAQRKTRRIERSGGERDACSARACCSRPA